jgi:membrane protein YqaA with SNARE-associated domain
VQQQRDTDLPAPDVDAQGEKFLSLPPEKEIVKQRGDMTEAPRKRVRLGRTVRIVIAAVAVAFALALWITLYRYPEYSKLLILFVYTIPSEFLIAVIPHEPIIFLYSKLYHPFTVTWVTLLATLFTEYLNYVLIDQFFRIPRIGEMKDHRYFQKFTGYFLKAPFISVVIAALTPIPFYPFRILASSSRYSLLRYLAGVAIGRAPRFYILAQFGYLVKIPNWVIISLFVVLFAASLIMRRRKNNMAPDIPLN